MHHHGYLWTGPKTHFDNEALRRPPHPQPPPTPAPNDPTGERLLHRYREVATAFPTSDLPPIEIAHWLLKPPAFIQGTWDAPEQAAAWLQHQLTSYAPRFASPHNHDRLAALVHSASTRLANGHDLAHGHYLDHPAYLHLALVTCAPNHAHPRLPCPLRHVPTE